jgi:hypothetical protein
LAEHEKSAIEKALKLKVQRAKGLIGHSKPRSSEFEIPKLLSEDLQSG